MTKKRMVLGLILLTLLTMVGADLGLVGSNVRQVVSLGREAGGAVPFFPHVGSVVWADGSVAAVLGRRDVPAGRRPRV
jgi:hypothetical protein